MQISVSYSHSPVFWATDNTSVRKLGSFTSLHWPLKDNRGLITFTQFYMELEIKVLITKLILYSCKFQFHTHILQSSGQQTVLQLGS